ncbi:flavodoxin domain-containing protein [Lentibacillus sp. Marseille-P4043]|uniref:flavodoxin domain-containing protein n=1 Tax=Lentibacillus sp. Marseille-P4043 TaxID=2040293 RepID=UPI000D0B2454|nr:flavodoxin domain-containing protein [Lentibacillus sp. Marseille-P4043]
MQIAIVYTSVTGNTKELAELLEWNFRERSFHVDLFHVKRFPHELISEYDAIVIGTYTWANGNIPAEMLDLYETIEIKAPANLVTGVFGTGDSFFPYFCGAVDEFRDMLYARTNLAVTLKVELRPQQDDVEKCKRFVECLQKEIQPLVMDGKTI